MKVPWESTVAQWTNSNLDVVEFVILFNNVPSMILDYINVCFTLLFHKSRHRNISPCVPKCFKAENVSIKRSGWSPPSD